jgi:hypothetical protein
MSRRSTTLLIGALVIAGGCSSLPRTRRAEARKIEYFAVPREISETVRTAIERGHVLTGMDQEQVWVVLGDPVWKSRFLSGERVIEVWIYPGIRMHQDQVRATAHSTFRIVFGDGRVLLIEPF